MDKTSLWCRLISSFSVISALFLLMVPEGALKKAFNTLLTVILTFVIIFPFGGEKKELLSLAESLDLLKAEEKTIDLQEYDSAALIYAAESEIESYLNETLESKKINCVCKAVCVYKNSEIHIAEVKVSGTIGKEDEASIRKAIEEISAGEAEVHFEGEEYD